MLQEKVKGR